MKYNLQPINTGQTLGSFLQHLKQIQFQENIHISVNNTLTETHIYLPEEETLPNHKVIEQFNISKYAKIPLLSNGNTN
jgi:hypothetical protein